MAAWDGLEIMMVVSFQKAKERETPSSLRSWCLKLNIMLRPYKIISLCSLQPGTDRVETNSERDSCLRQPVAPPAETKEI